MQKNINFLLLLIFFFNCINAGDSMNITNEIKIDEIYEHYSGKQYKIIRLAHHSENPEEILVIYEGLYDCQTFGKNPVWARPLKMFCEKVLINNKEQPRFKKLIK